MKTDPNIIAGSIGAVGAILKGAKKRHKIRTIIVNMIIGGLLAYLSMDIIPMFIEDISNRTSMLISFSIGYLSNEFTDHIENLLDLVIELISEKIKKVFK